MAANPNNPGLVGANDAPETQFAVTPGESELLAALSAAETSL